MKRGLSWEKFKAIQASFENVPGVRLFYCEGILEIVSIGKPHEVITAEFRIQESEFRSKTAFTPGFETLVVYLTFLEMRCKCLIAGLLITYFEVKGIEFFPSGSFSRV
ncbi:hypothetical protein [Nostoc sp.]